MLDDHRKPEEEKFDPERVERLFDLELMQKRAGWQQSKAQRGTWRMMSWLFLLAVIVAALAAFFLVLSPDRVRELKATNRPEASPAASAAER